MKLIGFKTSLKNKRKLERDERGRFFKRYPPKTHVEKLQASKWNFIISPRFWAMVGLAITVGLQQDGLIHGGLATALLTIFGGFFGVKSYEKYTSPRS